MATDQSALRSPLQRRELWNFLPFRALLLGTTDQSSVLSLLPKTDNLLNVILSPVVLHYEDETNAIDLHKGAEQGTLTKWQMVLVVCFAPGRVDELEGFNKQTPLHSAALFGHNEAVQLLLTADSDPNGQNKNNFTPLHYAAYNGHSEALQLLLTADGDPNARNIDKYTPLMYAKEYRNHECIELLENHTRGK